MTFAFGDRIRSRNEKLRCERWRRYLDHLATSQIDLTNAAVLALVGDVLHDSPIKMNLDLRTGDAILSGRNIFRIDRVAKAGQTAPLSLRFRDCQKLAFRRVGNDPTYYQSEVHKRADSRLEVRIAMKPLERGFDWIVIGCSTIDVESSCPPEAGIDYPSLASIEHAIQANEA